MRVFPLTLLITLLLCSFLKIHETDSTCSENDETIASEYLQNHTSLRVPFRIHGWRWHTMAVLRELQILQNVLKSPLGDSSQHEDIVAAIQHTIGFNMKGLHRVETTLFYPWLTKTFDTIPDSTVRMAFQRILLSVKQNQQSLIQHGSHVLDVLLLDVSQTDARERVVNYILPMISTLTETKRIQTEFLVPAVTVLVSESEQSSFNFRVLSSMGLWDSRIYLVAMYEAIKESSPEEQVLFEREIPSTPRYFIPRWKRLLYDPSTRGILSTSSTCSSNNQ